MKKTLLGAALAAAFPCAIMAQVLCLPENFGGYASSIHLNTKAIQQAIDKCALTGGEVRLGRGLWLSGPIELKSGVTLNLSADAVLKADNREKMFVDAYIGRPTAPNEAFIWANDAQNIALIGSGTIDGSGAEYWWEDALALRQAVKAGDTAQFEAKYPGVKLANGMPRPWLIEFNAVENAMVYGVTLTNSPMWNLVIRNSRNVLVDGLKVKSPEESPNTDGIDIVSSQRVHVKNAFIHTGDDNIAIKSGVEQNGAAPSADILIEDSIMDVGHGISIGSETANGIGAVTVRNVSFKQGENGVRIKSARDRGNNIGPLTVENVTMDGVATPVLVTLSYAGQPGASGLGLTEEIPEQNVTSYTPKVKGVTVRNLKATGANIAALLNGLPESPVQEVLFEHVDIDSKLGVQARYVEGTFINTKVQASEGDYLVRGPHSLIKEAR